MTWPFDIAFFRLRHRRGWLVVPVLAATAGILLWLFLGRGREPTPVPLPAVGRVELATLDAAVDELVAWHRLPEALAQVLAGQRQVEAADNDPARLATLLLREMELRAEIMELPAAEAAGHRAVAILTERLGPERVETADGLLRLARFLADAAHRYPQAMAAWRRAIAILDPRDGDDGLKARLGLVEFLAQTADHAAAEALLGETLALAQTRQGAESIAVARVHLAHADWIRTALDIDTGFSNPGDYEAEEHLEKAWAILHAQAPAGHALRRECLMRLARLVDHNYGDRRAMLGLLLAEWREVRSSHGDDSLAALQAGLDYLGFLDNGFLRNPALARGIASHLVAAWNRLPPGQRLGTRGRRLAKELVGLLPSPEAGSLLSDHLSELTARHGVGSLALASILVDERYHVFVRQFTSAAAAEAMLDDALANASGQLGADNLACLGPLWELFVHHGRSNDAVAQDAVARRIKELVDQHYGRHSVFAQAQRLRLAWEMNWLVDNDARQLRPAIDLLAAQSRAWGEGHPALAHILTSGAAMYAYVDAPNLRKAIYDRVDAYTHARSADANAVWNAYFDFLDQPGRRRVPEALAMLDRAVAIARATHGAEHPCLLILGERQAETAELDDAHYQLASEIRQSQVALAERIYGADSLFVGPYLVRLVRWASPMSPLDVATARRRLDALRARHGPGHPAVAVAAVSLSDTFLLQGDAKEARDCLQEALAIARDYRGCLPLARQVVDTAAEMKAILGLDVDAEALVKATALLKPWALPEDLRAAGLFPEFVADP
jgi:tetratricopeptide (TPR) repeat protein